MADTLSTQGHSVPAEFRTFYQTEPNLPRLNSSVYPANPTDKQPRTGREGQKVTFCDRGRGGVQPVSIHGEKDASLQAAGNVVHPHHRRPVLLDAAQPVGAQAGHVAGQDQGALWEKWAQLTSRAPISDRCTADPTCLSEETSCDL